MRKKKITEEKYGFVYIWRDRKHKRYYIGCHWGTEHDGYICSSRWMRKAFRRRPDDFKRRIIARIYSSRKELIEEEFRWLSLISMDELGKRYYNHSKMRGNFGTFSDETRKKMSESKQGKSVSPSTQFKPGSIPWNKGKKGLQTSWNAGKKGELSHMFENVVSDETRKRISNSQKGKPRPLGSGMTGRRHTEETKRKISDSKRSLNSSGS